MKENENIIMTKKIGIFDGRFWFKEDPFGTCFQEFAERNNPAHGRKLVEQFKKAEEDKVVVELLCFKDNIVGTGAVYTPFPSKGVTIEQWDIMVKLYS